MYKVKGRDKIIKGRVVKFAIHIVDDNWKHQLKVCIGLVVAEWEGVISMIIENEERELVTHDTITSRIHILPLHEEIVWKIRNNI